jgi:iron complex outermembrane receptor protein
VYKRSGGLYLCLLCLAIQGTAHAAGDDDDLAGAYGGKDFISIATGSRKPVARAPAVASVITADDIKATGATDVDEALESVPGLHVSRSLAGLNPIYSVRGIYTQYNPQVLVMINGIPITDLYGGDRSQAWGGLPVADIARIEVIRGPGSALYGADAFAGTINIVTKTADDIHGTEIGARAGTYHTRDGWLLHGGQWGTIQGAFSLEVRRSDGDHGTVDADYQTFFDSLFATSASNAPGPLQAQRDSIDARLDLARGDWRLRLGYQGRRNLGTGAGIAQALDSQGAIDGERYNGDLTFHTLGYSDNLDVTAQLSYFNTQLAADLVLFPPGAFANAYPQGMIGSPTRREQHLRLNGNLLFTGWTQHRVRVGAGVNYDDLYSVGESKNFSGAGVPFPGSPPPVLDVSGVPGLVYIQPHTRTVVYGLAQDEWAVARDWELTAGVRYDHYSDFGNTVNPRLALVWQTTYNLTSKLLYGRAFRAPAFSELYNINNPVALGNANLQPETIDTVELAWDWRPTPGLRAGVNIFHYEMGDIIRFIPDPAPAPTTTAQNSGDQHGNGMEWEFAWKASTRVQLSGNYAYQRSIDEANQSDVGYAPEQHAYARLDWGMTRTWRANAQANWVATRKRSAGDTRDTLADYTVVDMTLRYEPSGSVWSTALSVRNLFDHQAREPSPAPGVIVNDLPLPGRALYLELRVQP